MRASGETKVPRDIRMYINRPNGALFDIHSDATKSLAGTNASTRENEAGQENKKKQSPNSFTNFGYYGRRYRVGA